MFVYTEPRSACTEPRSANQNLGRPTSLAPAAPRPLRLRHRHEKPVIATPLISVIYKCPLQQPLSFDILTNAPGVCGSTLPFLKSYLKFTVILPLSRKKPISKSLVFNSLRTLPRSVSCNPFACHSYENCRVYTNNSHFGSPRVSSRGTRLPAPLLRRSRNTGHGTQYQSPVCPTGYLSRGRASSVLLEPAFLSNKLSTGHFSFFSCVGGCDG